MLFTLATNLLYSVFLITWFFATLLNFDRSVRTVANLPASILSTSVFRLAKFVFDAKLLTSTCATFLNQFLLHN